MNWAETGESFNRIATGPTHRANGSSKTSRMCSLPCHRIAHYRTEQGDTFLFSGAFVIFYNSRVIFTTPSSFRSIGSGHRLFNPPKGVGIHRVAEVSVRGWVCKAALHRLRARLQSSGREKRLDMLWCCVARTPITALEAPGRLGTPAHYQRRGASAATPFLRVEAEVRCSRTGHQSVHLCAGTVSMAPVTSVGGGMGLAERLRMGRLEEDGLSYKESFIVRCYEVGINKTATVETIANLLQEVGCNHAQSVGFSTDGFATTNTMRELRLIWVTSRMHIEIYKYPAWGDVVEIETWCQGEGRIGTRRDWIIKDLSVGSIIGRATSKWVMMNQDTRKLQRVSDEVREEYLIYCPRTVRLAFPEEDSDSLKKIFELEDPADYSRLGLVPRRADLDMNQHVNNVTYIGWVLESMPQAIIDTHELQTITLDYRRECRHDDMVDSLTSSESEEIVLAESTNGSPSIKQHGCDHLQFLHFLRLSGTGLEINRGRTIWRKLMR